MSRVSIILLGVGLACVGSAARADDFIGAGDLTILSAPRMNAAVSSAQAIHHPDQGKSFEVVCSISSSGRLSDCQTQATYIHDTAYVAAALNSFDQMVVATTGRHSGQSVVGRKVRLTMTVDYGDGPESL